MPLLTATNNFQTMEIREDNGKTGDLYEIIVRTNLCDRSISIQASSKE